IEAEPEDGAASHDGDPDFTRTFLSDRCAAVAPHIESGKTLELVMEMHIEGGQGADGRDRRHQHGGDGVKNDSALQRHETGAEYIVTGGRRPHRSRYNYVTLVTDMTALGFPGE